MAIDTKKEQERDELHRAIWAIADELRGAVDGWDFKNYVLGTMFYRYISENLTAYINEGEINAGNTDFDYAKMSDSDAEQARDGLVQEKGFFTLPSDLFCNVREAASSDTATFVDREGNTQGVKANLNEKLEIVFSNIENSAKGSQSESDFAGLFDDFDVNSNKLGSTVAKRNERLTDVTDDIVFEVELIKQVEINIDYILLLVKKYHDSHGEDKEILVTIQKAVDASPELRSKKALIETFIAGVNDVEDVMDEWRDYVVEMRDKALNFIIEIENLRPVETRTFVKNAFCEGGIKTVGTDIDKILPPVSRFGGGNRDAKKKSVIDRLMAYFEQFYGIGGEFK